jgi:hypothetical protein
MATRFMADVSAVLANTSRYSSLDVPKEFTRMSVGLEGEIGAGVW